jgi:predicted ATP-grasp superfamily ATP-dependent carboligase
VLAASELPPELAARFSASVPPPAALGALVNKACLHDWLSELGVPSPRTTRLRAARDLNGVPDDLLARSFLKPADSYTFQTRCGRKALWFGSLAEARCALEDALADGCELLLQEYVPGPPTAHHFVDGFVDRHGRITAMFARQRLRMWPPDFGDSSAMVSVPLDAVAPAVGSLETLLHSVSYRGIFSAEFKRDARDGVFRLLDVNARVWKYVDFAASCGVDVCRMAYDDAMGKDVDAVRGYTIGATCVDVYFDRMPCFRLFRERRLGLVEWARCWLRSHQIAWAWDDPLPGLSWAAAFALPWARRSGKARIDRVYGHLPSISADDAQRRSATGPVVARTNSR